MMHEKKWKSACAALPGVLWYSVFFFVPVSLVMFVSLARRGTYGGIEWSLGLANYVRAFDFAYLRIFGITAWLASISTILCAALGVPLALAVYSMKPRLRVYVLAAIAFPFFANLVVRVAALKSLLAYDGFVAVLLRRLSIEFDPFALSQNQGLVVFMMVTTYLPFMLYPVYSALEKFDNDLIWSAQDLGATYWQSVWRVVLPMLKKAIMTGAVLVWVPAMGEFVIPDLLGGSKRMYVGNLISEQFLKARDWPFGAALAVLLLVLILFVRRWGVGDAE